VTFEEISLSGLDEAIQQTSKGADNVTDETVREQLQQLKTNLGDMRLALVELRHLEDEFKRGNIMSEMYLDRHKKLVRDYLAARDHIGDVVVPKLAEKAPLGDSRSKIAKFRDALKNNKEFLLNVSQLIISVVQLFGKS